jgi:hypothetical protein
MKRYRMIQEEVIKDYGIDPKDLDVPFKNSIQATLDVFYNIGLLLSNDEDFANEFKNELRKKYELSIFIK